MKSAMGGPAAAVPEVVEAAAPPAVEGGNTPAGAGVPAAVPLGMGPFGAPPLLVPLLDMAIRFLKS